MPELHETENRAALLDNPIWNALASRQLVLSQGDGLARRFPADIGPLAGLVEQTPDAYVSLASLANGEQMVLFLDQPPALPPGWTLCVGGNLLQMVYEREAPGIAHPELLPLGEEDIPEMLALTRLTKPGPFRQRTIELSGYIGIRQDGRLAAMAGERLKMDGFTEVSAVCTHPDFQGRGYAGILIEAVCRGIQNRGETPFLHVFSENTGAIGLYEKLGFTKRRSLHLAVVRLNPA